MVIKNTFLDPWRGSLEKFFIYLKIIFDLNPFF